MRLLRMNCHHSHRAGNLRENQESENDVFLHGILPWALAVIAAASGASDSRMDRQHSRQSESQKNESEKPFHGSYPSIQSPPRLWNFAFKRECAL